VPLVVVPPVRLPGFVGESTLVCVESSDPSDPACADALAEAKARGASAILVAGEGRLAEVALELGVERLGVPRSARDARAALGHLVAPLFVLAHELGVLPGGREAIEAAMAATRRRRAALLGGDSPALRLARAVDGSFPLVLGAAGPGAVAARRLATAVRLGPKVLALAACSPDLERDWVSAFGQAGDVTRQLLVAVELLTSFDPPRDVRLAELLDEVVAARERVEAQGDGRLAQLLDLVLVGDVAALELAAAAGVDPGPAPAVGEVAPPRPA